MSLLAKRLIGCCLVYGIFKAPLHCEAISSGPLSKNADRAHAVELLKVTRAEKTRRQRLQRMPVQAICSSAATSLTCSKDLSAQRSSGSNEN